MTRRGRWSHCGGSAGRPRCENSRKLAVQLRIRENALVTEFYGLRHCRSLCFLASQSQLHLRSLCHSCCWFPPARRFRRPTTPTTTRAGSPCVGLYAGVTGRGSGRLPGCSMQLLEHPGSVGVVEPLKEPLARRLEAPSVVSPTQLRRAAAKVSFTTRCQPPAKAPRRPRLPCSPGTSSAHVCRALLARLQPLDSVSSDAARQNTR
jgi:hypothetical protein